MHYILYNPKSNLGKTEKDVLKLERKLNKKGIVTMKYDLFALKEPLKIREKVKDDDVIILAGGDGTLSRLVNNKLFASLNNKIFLYRSGRGNDFSREFKGDFFEITNNIKNLPSYSYGDINIKFLNGLGVGIDALTCKKQMENFLKGERESYFSIAWNAFKTFKPFSLDIEIDGVKHHYDNVWFFTVQNGKYFGGGMRISPKSIREDEYLEFVVIHNVGFKKLLSIFPLIFIGKHTLAKNHVTIIRGKKFIIDLNGYNTFQADGEVDEIPNHLEVYR